MDRDLIGSVSLQLTAKARGFLAKHKCTEFLLDVELTEEPCTQIYSPVLTDLTEKTENFQSLGQFEGINLYFTPRFIEIFSIPSVIELSAEGLLRKHLIVKSIDPIIKNICKIPDV